MEKEKENKKQESKVCIQVLKVFESKNAPHFQTFMAAIHGSKGGKKRGKDATSTFHGYLPSYSPGIEYWVTIDGENKIVSRESWKRLRYWLTKDFVKETLKTAWGPKNESVSRLFEKTRCTEESLEEFSKSPDLKEIYRLFKGHFMPNVWFDLAMLKSENKNVFSSYMLESRREAISSWQKILDEDLVRALLLEKHPVPKLSWELAQEIIKMGNQHYKEGTLTEGDKEYEASLKKWDATELLLVGNTTSAKLPLLVQPPIPKHEYKQPPATFIYTYKLVLTIETKLEFSEETVFPFRVDIAEVKSILNDSKILYEVQEGTWSLPTLMYNASIINEFLDHYAYTWEIPPPSTVEEALEYKIAIIATKGHNAFEVYRRLVERQEDEKIAFICPNYEAAVEFNAQTDGYAYPQKSDPDAQTLIFCFSQNFSLASLEKHLGDYVRNQSKEKWPKKVLFFGDPKMVGNDGNGAPFREMVELKKFPIFEFNWDCTLSEIIYTEPIQGVIQGLDEFQKSSDIPWSSDIQICSPEKFKFFYDELLASKDPLHYHILVEGFMKYKDLEKEVRSKPPNGLHVHDKVTDPEKRQLRCIRSTKTWLTEDRRGLEEPRNIAMTNKQFHTLAFFGEGPLEQKKCCDQRYEYHNIKDHEFQWATIQTFRNNCLIKRDHIILILSEKTRKSHIYTAACMAIKKLTIVGTMSQLDEILRRPPQKKIFSLIDYTTDRSKRVTVRLF